MSRVGMPKDQTQFFIEEVQELKSWHRIMLRGAIAGIMFGVVFAVFISIWGSSVIIGATGEWMPEFAELSRVVSKVVELFAFCVFGIGGAVATKKMGVIGLYSLIKEHMERVDKSPQKDIDDVIGFTCERCGTFISNGELEMIQKGAPIAHPNAMCEMANGTGKCLYAWARDNYKNNQEKGE